MNSHCFESLTEEKQKRIRDASLHEFGSLGYRKTSVRDIAEAAGISKSMIFHYFGTKKDLYLYLIDYCNQQLDIIARSVDPTVTDFFDRLAEVTSARGQVLGMCPYMFDFIASTYFEHDPEVAEELKKSRLTDNFSSLLLQGSDMSRLRDDVDPGMLFQIIRWITTGFYTEASREGEPPTGKLQRAYYNAVKFLKRCVYRPEYLQL